MARLDVFRLANGGAVIDCQSDLLAHLTSRFIVPLIEPGDLSARIAGLHPIFEVAGATLVMMTHLAGAIPAKALGNKIGSLDEHHYVVQRALDMLSGSY